MWADLAPSDLFMWADLSPSDLFMWADLSPSWEHPLTVPHKQITGSTL
jgi:hypothetical protein